MANKNFEVKHGLSVGGTERITSAGAGSFTDLTLSGDLNITGDVNSVSVTDLDVTDKTITLGKGQTESNSGGSGIIVDGSSASILWDESNDEFDINKSINVDGTGRFNSGTGNIVATFQSTDTGSFINLIDNGSGTFGGLIGAESDDIVLSPNNVEAVRIKSDGKVGIGTSSPGALLDLSGVTASSPPKLRLSGTGEGSAGDTIGQIDFHSGDTTDNTAGIMASIKAIAGPSGGEGHLQFLTDMPSEGAAAATVALHLHANANVGIGTTSPSYKLDISGTGDTVQYIANANPSHSTGRTLLLRDNYASSSQDSKISFAATSSPGHDVYLGKRTTSNAGYFHLTNSSGTEHLTVNMASGDVGIGTTSPASLLHIKNTTAEDTAIILENTNNAQNLNIDYYNNAGSVQSRINYAEGPAAWNFIPNTSNGNSALYINYSSHVGVGTSSPAGRLHISGNSDVSDEDCMLIIDDVDGSAGSRIPAIMFRSNTSGTVTNQGRIRGTGTQGMVLSGSSALGNDLVVQSDGVLVGSTTNLNVLTGTPKIQVGDGTGHSSIQWYSGTNSVAGLYFGDATSGDARYSGYIEYRHNTNTMAFRVNGTDNVIFLANGQISCKNITATDSAGNVSIGYGALNVVQANSGDANVAVGYEALEDVTTGSNNTGIGYRAAMNITSGNYNTALGTFTMYTNTNGSRNTALGYQSLYSATGNDHNTAIGNRAMVTASNNGSCTAVGSQALEVCTTGGHYNTAIGAEAGLACTSGQSNVFVGRRAGYDATDANNNVFVGQNTQNDNAGTSNQVVIGNTARSQGGGKFTVGTSNSTYSYLTIGSSSWSGSSDVRLKKEITDSTAGLSFINDLRPITFKWKTKGEVDKSLPHYEKDSNEPAIGNSDSNVLTKHGFIAQEVKAVIDNHTEIKDGSEIWEENRDGVQNFSPTALIPMLVKSIQELKTKNDALEARIETLEG